MIPSNILSNLAKVEQLLKKTPNATHVYMRTDNDRYVDIPMGNAEFTIRNKPKWTVENLAVSEVRQSPAANPWPSQKISDIGKGKMDTPVLPADAAPVEVPPKPSEETTAAASTDGQADAAADQNTANVDTSADAAPVKAQYRALKNFEHAGVQHKYRETLELTDEEAAAFPAECLKKVDA